MTIPTMAWNNKRKGESQGNGGQPFWVTCPKCKEKLAVPQAWVLKYLARIGYEVEPNQED